MKFVFATGNAGKLREAREILGPDYEVVRPEDVGVSSDVDETGNTLKENSILKAETIWRASGLDCFADDSGLEVDALGGAPGIYSARYAALAGGADHNFSDNIDRLLSELEKHPGEPRTARFKTVVTLIMGGEKYFFEGRCEGKITFERSGNGGFGYDPVFIPDAFPDRTMADLGEEIKNTISHRGEALRKMAAFLKQTSR